LSLTALSDASLAHATGGLGFLEVALVTWENVQWSQWRFLCSWKDIKQDFSVVLDYHTIFFCTGDWIQGFILTRQVLYHLSYTSSLFCVDYFSDRVLLYARASLNHDPPVFVSLWSWG
jgi:hypothetical protein